MTSSTISSISPTTHDNAPRVGFVSLGCPKATVDSELILSQLRAQGYAIANDYQEAALVIVNTCGFIDAAVEESLDAIGEAIEESGRVIVTGCLGARSEVIRAAHPSVLAVTGPQAVDEVMDLVRSELPAPHDPFMDLVPPGGVKLTPRHYAYLKISEGCNHHCTFCIIPSMRGRLVSRPVEDVLSEAQALTGAGVRELLVISQDTSAYGVDVRYRNSFFGQRPVKTSMIGLAEALSAAPFDPDVWIRLHYVYPYPHVDEVIPLMAQGRVLPYLDVPFQHASPDVLKRMRRPAHGERNLERIKQWRKICPELVIRSTFIVGFPGETEAEFNELLEFIAEAELDRVGCFTYSPVDGAAANALADPVEQALAQDRRERLMELQADVSAGKLYQREGQVLRCLVDEVNDDTLVARSYADAPEIDGVVHVQLRSEDDSDDQSDDTNTHQVGDFVDVEIKGATEHDLYGQIYKDDD